MVFSSIPFLFYFLPITLAVYFLAPRSLRNGVLFFASLFFYAWGEPIYVGIMLFSTVVDYCHGLMIAKFLEKGKKRKGQTILFSSIFINLALLCFFKYSDFFIANINQLTGGNIAPLNLPLPIGISFYTFQTMSYSIDVYRGEAKAQKNILSFGAYVALFPQLIAGPIVRYQTIAKELDGRRETVEGFSQGALRFVIGLGKKVILANNIGFLWDTVAAMEQVPQFTAWLGLLAFAFQIYFDFSGYSDMAIGLGKMLGFSFPENFNYPYVSKSITEFWRRWHISLGTWFREYVYIPLGGNRKGRGKTLKNIMVVWLLTGLWHGAAWNFILWGVYFGSLLLAEKLFYGKWLEKAPGPLRHGYALFFILLGWGIFAFDQMGQMGKFFTALIGGSGAPFWDNQTLYLISSYWPLFLLLILGSTPLPKKWAEQLLKPIGEKAVSGVVSAFFMAVVLIVSVAFIINATYNPFLYFRF